MTYNAPESTTHPPAAAIAGAAAERLLAVGAHERSQALASLVAALGAHASESGVVGLVSIGDDTFLIVRVDGGRARLLLSDQTAALDWDLADEVLDALGVEAPEDVDDDADPVGDLGLLADLGMSTDELTLLCEDLDLYPDEVLGSVAKRIGFGELFANLVFDRG